MSAFFHIRKVTKKYKLCFLSFNLTWKWKKKRKKIKIIENYFTQREHIPHKENLSNVLWHLSRDFYKARHVHFVSRNFNLLKLLRSWKKHDRMTFKLLVTCHTLIKMAVSITNKKKKNKKKSIWVRNIIKYYKNRRNINGINTIFVRAVLRKKKNIFL